MLVLHRSSCTRKIRAAGAIALFLCAAGMTGLAGCHSKPGDAAPQPVTITFIGRGPATLSELAADRSVLSRFTQKTGIQVKLIVGPESMTDRLQLYLDALERKSSTPDVLYTDVIWPGVLAEYTVDLKPFTTDGVKLVMPTALQNDTVDGRLVAMPFSIEVGLLYYRTDLLTNMDSRGHQKPGTNWRRWLAACKMGSAPKAGRIFGDTCGRALSTKD
jgi:ABC-type glycerol-3-phosphate transport system substrate-binding protein